MVSRGSQACHGKHWPEGMGGNGQGHGVGEAGVHTIIIPSSAYAHARAKIVSCVPKARLRVMRRQGHVVGIVVAGRRGRVPRGC